MAGATVGTMPRFDRVVELIPRTPAGKILRRSLGQDAAVRAGEEAAAAG